MIKWTKTTHQKYTKHYLQKCITWQRVWPLTRQKPRNAGTWTLHFLCVNFLKKCECKLMMTTMTKHDLKYMWRERCWFINNFCVVCGFLYQLMLSRTFLLNKWIFMDKYLHNKKNVFIVRTVKLINWWVWTFI